MPLAGWTRIFYDDFNVDVPEGKWPTAKWKQFSYPHWPDTSHNGVYSNEIVSQHDSLLDIHIRTEGNVHKVAAPCPTLPGASSKNGMSAGRYQVRFKADPIPGYKTAWLLWPDSEIWPRDGEIDFPEGDLAGTISGYVHHQNGTSPSDQTAISFGVRYDQWHTATIIWDPPVCKFNLDGVVHTTRDRVPSTPMHWVIQTETQLSGGPPPNDAEGHIYLDWVKVWSKA